MPHRRAIRRTVKDHHMEGSAPPKKYSVGVCLCTKLSLILIRSKQARAGNKMRPGGFSLMVTDGRTDGHTLIKRCEDASKKSAETSFQIEFEYLDMEFYIQLNPH